MYLPRNSGEKEHINESQLKKQKKKERRTHGGVGSRSRCSIHRRGIGGAERELRGSEGGFLSGELGGFFLFVQGFNNLSSDCPQPFLSLRPQRLRHPRSPPLRR